MNVGIGNEAALFPEKEYIMEISFAVHAPFSLFHRLTRGSTELIQQILLIGGVYIGARALLVI